MAQSSRVLSRWQRVRAGIVVLLAVGSLAFAQDAASGPAARTGGTLTVAMSATIATLEPHRDTTTQGTTMRNPLYDTLVRFTDEGKIEPALATSWKISPDRKVWTFTFRRGVTFHDGSPFNAAAVKANFDRLLDPNRPRTAAYNVQRQISRVEEGAGGRFAGYRHAA